MKKLNLLLVFTIAAFLMACSNDDDNTTITDPNDQGTAEASIILNEISFLGSDRVEIKNIGTTTRDVSGYWLCLGPGQYFNLANLTAVSGSTTLDPEGLLVVELNLPDTDGGLGLYKNNDGFADANNIIDFVQWGTGGSPRENVAVTANIWTVGDFVPVVSVAGASIEFDGEGNSSTDWSQENNPSFGEQNDFVTPTTTFSVTISNVTNYLNAIVFNTPNDATNPGPVPTVNGSYSIQFKAVPGAKLNFVTMSAATNDWFFAPLGGGINLWENGNVVTGDVSSQIYLWDAGTEEEDPTTIATVPDGETAGDPDDDTSIRVVETDVTSYLRTELAYDAASRYFTLTLTNLMGAAGSVPTVLTPGLVVLHAQNNPFFTSGQSDRGVGLKGIAEAGNPTELYNWFSETGASGAPLRLSSSLSVFSPAVIYAFNTASDPLFSQGSVAMPNSGVEEIAEDGNNQIAYEYLSGLGLPVAKSNETTPVGPGQDLTFTIEVPVGYKFGYSTMLVQTNDWFIAYNNSGYELFDENGNPKNGDEVSIKSYLYDAGTEVDQAVGFGVDQAPRQSEPNTGIADSNTTIRRVSELDDQQFGKGIITTGPGVVNLEDDRGGYNVVKVTIQAQ